MRMEDIDLGEDFDFEQMLNESFEQSENNSVVDGVIVDINAERVRSEERRVGKEC